jgi:RNA polymerase sigma-70 factor (ECF subfamily)
MNISDLKAELEQLHASSFGWTLSCCRRDRETAEEVLQSVYLKILEGKARYRGDSTLKTWLFTVIRNTAISERRKTLLRSLTRLTALNKTIERAGVTAEPAAEFERSEVREQFQRVLKQLSTRQREVLHLVFYEDLSLREAADVMGVSIGSARQHYERGKKHLRDLLDREEVEYGVIWKRKENPDPVS